MELEALDAVFLDQLSRLAAASLPLCVSMAMRSAVFIRGWLETD